MSVYWLSSPSRVRKTSCAHDFIPCSAGWDHSRWVASPAAPPAYPCLPLPAPLPFACGRTGQPPRHVSSWVACWFRLYQITTTSIDYACLLSPVDTLPPPPSPLLPQPSPPHPVPCVLAVSCRVVSCPGSLYHCVCTCRVTQRALLGLCRSCLLTLLRRRLVLLLLLLPLPLLMMMMMLLSSPALTLPLSMTNENQYLLDYFRNFIRK